jgi:Lrp/AsnC family transcriptional regulator, leucine-responsive regulatory protein
MKNIIGKLVNLLGSGYCTPQIARIAIKLKEPATTIHYNIKKLEKEGKIKKYKAVFNYKEIGKGFCTFCLLNLSPDEYGNPERICEELQKFDEIESIDIITGDWEIILKIRTADQDEYYEFVKQVLSRKGVIKIKTLTSVKQIKTEFTPAD